jgi:hypothetical protein
VSTLSKRVDSEYNDGYEQGYEDAFVERTAEALALIRALWHKLSDARKERNLWRSLACCEVSVPYVVKQLVEAERENRSQRELIEDLRAEIVRVQSQGRQHIVYLTPPLGSGNITSTKEGSVTIIQ